MIHTAYIEQSGTGQLGAEERMVADTLHRRGVAIKYFSKKHISRRQLPLTPETLVVGDVDSFVGALRQLGVPIPSSDPYPDCLRPFLHRSVWNSTVGEEIDYMRSDGAKPRFVKPCGRAKSFTGFVLNSSNDIPRFLDTSRSERVSCSDVVGWVSEYRFYVVENAIRAISHYFGEEDERLSRAVVEDAVGTLASSGIGMTSYGIDFGTLTTGETALIELNDGFSLGAYGIGPEDYTDLVTSRWLELVSRYV
ncbi:ATP-grasp domain-containing protein [Bremerella sp. P1]|uniref:ATP-grasp domain-containing protein n=1 Tax=Bremerella sp. P1 TaxID=3026424 RepID=UPI002367F419|nr:ATP-grasp domain-containing protein [Bremerella sp. P1]WDI43204.1 ATP-grasp domain-containing protein [Bremerella sp. P1]